MVIMTMVEIETDYLGPPREDLLPSYRQLQGGPPQQSVSLPEVTSFLWQPTTVTARQTWQVPFQLHMGCRDRPCVFYKEPAT